MSQEIPAAVRFDWKREALRIVAAFDVPVQIKPEGAYFLIRENVKRIGGMGFETAVLRTFFEPSVIENQSAMFQHFPAIAYSYWEPYAEYKRRFLIGVLALGYETHLAEEDAGVTLSAHERAEMHQGYQVRLKHLEAIHE